MGPFDIIAVFKKEIKYIFPAAGDGERHAGFPSAVQREAERIDSFARAQRTDHYGEG